MFSSLLGRFTSSSHNKDARHQTAPQAPSTTIAEEVKADVVGVTTDHEMVVKGCVFCDVSKEKGFDVVYEVSRPWSCSTGASLVLEGMVLTCVMVVVVAIVGRKVRGVQRPHACRQAAFTGRSQTAYRYVLLFVLYQRFCQFIVLPLF